MREPVAPCREQANYDARIRRENCISHSRNFERRVGQAREACKRLKATCLSGSTEERMVAFCDFPKEQWKHLQTTNVV